jgi:hypothetical protein
MEIKPSKGVKVLVNAQREAVFGDESVSVKKTSLNDGLKVGEMTGLTLAGFCEVEMPKLDGKKMTLEKVVSALNVIGGANGIGKIDMFEDEIGRASCRERV